MWLRGSRRKTYSVTGGFLVTVSASVVARITYSSALVRLNTLSPHHTHAHTHTRGPGHAHTHGDILTHTLTHAREGAHAHAGTPPSLPVTRSAAHMPSSPSPREPRTARLPPGTAFHLPSGPSRARFMSWFKGHLLPSPSLGHLGAPGRCPCWTLMLPFVTLAVLCYSSSKRTGVDVRSAPLPCPQGLRVQKILFQ